jgi:hypothetical protein
MLPAKKELKEKENYYENIKRMLRGVKKRRKGFLVPLVESSHI